MSQGKQKRNVCQPFGHSLGIWTFRAENLNWAFRSHGVEKNDISSTRKSFIINDDFYSYGNNDGDNDDDDDNDNCEEEEKNFFH